VSGRLAKLAGLFATVRGWSNLPMPQSEQVTELLVGQAVGPVIDLDQPIDFALAAAGAGTHVHAQFAVSAGVKDVDAAKTSLSEHYKLVPTDNGALLVQGLGHGSGQEDSDGDEGDHRACELAPAYGAASTRIVCGVDAKALSDLAPWLTRTAPRAPSSSDLHVDVRMQPLRPTVAGLKRMFSVMAGGVLGGPSGKPDVGDAAMRLGNDLVDFVLDVDSVALDVQISDASAGLTTTTEFSGSSSAFTRLVTAHADGGSRTPAAFWQLPADTDSAWFYRGFDMNDLDRVRDVALKLLDLKLTEDGVKDVDRKLLADALAKVFSPAPAVYASGFDLEEVKKARGASAALGPSADPSQEVEAARLLAEALLGWHLAELDEPSSRLSSALKDLATAWSRPGLLGLYRVKIKGGSPPVIRPAPVRKGSGLPKDAQHYVIEVPFTYDSPGGSRGTQTSATVAKAGAKPAKARPKPLLVHVLIAGDGPRTWLAFGGDETLVVSKLAGVLAGRPANERSDLEFFKEARLGAAGFFTLRAGTSLAQQMGILLGELLPGSLDAIDDLAHVPHGGNTPIVYSLTSQAGGPPAVVVANMQIPRAAIEDAVVGALRHGGI